MGTPRFQILNESVPIGFHTHVTIDLDKSIEDQLHRQRLFFRTGAEKGDATAIRKIISNNASLRVGFGWSFESERLLADMMNECLYELSDNFNSSMPHIISDLRGDWIGFVPYDAFQQYDIEQLSLYGMILFNNELINFQIDVMKFITQHKTFRQHAIVRDRDYCFSYMKAKRKSEDDLDDAFDYYVQAVLDITGLKSVPKRYIEESIGVHYLNHPDLFFELINFYTLKGLIYE